MLGTLDLNLRTGKKYTIIGGPFTDQIKGTVGVKMAAEIKRNCDIDIPTRDFQTPNEKQLTEGLIIAINCITAGKPLYVGCMAGRGRTGLFLAILAKAFGEEKPVEYVRKNYYSHAVETDDQYAFVMNFPIPREVKSRLYWARWWSYLTFKNNLTNLDGVL